ncbi:MAG TPA: 2-phospho-L-lactate guanylyltransferase [Xanthobacteraceae bacterium]|jgi:2-phospho-L-lactate guanylyltransferase
MNAEQRMCAVVPVKDSREAKQRLASVLSAAQRQALALAMLEDVLAALTRVPELAGILVVSADAAAKRLARGYRARITEDAAGEGHTAAVSAAAARLAAQGLAMLTLPADVPLVEPEDVRQAIAAHRHASSRTGCGFTIVPARNERGSNAVICSPADVVPLRFGDDSFVPHLAAAQSRGLAPQVLRLPRIALDIDTPEDLALLMEAPSAARARMLLAHWRAEELVLPDRGAGPGS